MTEAIFAVTPSETIKWVSSSFNIYFFRHVLVVDLFRTKLIDDAKRPNPQYKGLIHGTASIIRQEGISGIYRGLFPVVCKRHTGLVLNHINDFLLPLSTSSSPPF